MLQKIRERSSGWLAFIILGLIIITMAFFGVESYFAPKVETWVARITGPERLLGYGEQVREIGPEEFRRRFDQARLEARESQGDAFDAAAFESPENRRRILDSLVDEALLALAAERAGISVPEAEVAALLKQMPEFQANGQYSADLYRLGLAARGMTHAQFMAATRADMARRLLPSQVIETAIATASDIDDYLRMSQQTRDLRLVDLPTPSLEGDAPDEAALRAWYRDNIGRYRSEEKVAIEYVEIDAGTLDVPTVVDEATLRQRYQDNRARYVNEPGRTASHILVAVPADADGEAVEAARQRAEALAARAREPGADFSAIARESSDDLGSRDQGGDLGVIEKGLYAPAFEDALFSLEEGQVSDPVRTPDGWHVIWLRELGEGSERSFEEVRAELEAEYLATERERRYSQLAGDLMDAVYKDPTSLQPSAERFGLKVERTGLFSRAGGEGIAALPEVVEAAFADAQRLERQVSDAIDIGENHMVVLRVVEHVPAADLPFEEVAERVRADHTAARLADAARVQAEALLARALAGESLDVLAAEVSRTVAGLPGVNRRAPLPPQVLDVAFSLAPPEDGKPSVGIAELAPDRYALIAVDKVTPGDPGTLDEATRSLLREQLAQARGLAELQEYLQALRQYYSVRVAEDRL
ncbi:SurA N-terminal domain-containing protein [Arenimonas fontis]|uniref:Periplasmic chaperone PpiD n=1 Tax=Arenimonas fontis TaxID=2608255 RepID=A0A5B2ZC60_9GAMM|nr:SurA N-terminal domain-containing protein [Arenimonas fontis]KAA2285659.1 peptidylprolyl isomerase [Arenimonas fontis]